MTGLPYDSMAWDDFGLDEESHVPLWYQLAQLMRTAIRTGEFQPGEMLPSEAGLNQRFGVSRTTSRAALNSLQDQGYIRRRSGRGSIVLPVRLDQPLSFLRSFADDMRARNLQPGYVTHSVREVTADIEVTEAFGLAPGSTVLKINRTLLADKTPMAFSVVTLNFHALPPGPLPTIADLDSGSLYEWLRTQHGTRLVCGNESIEAAQAGDSIARAWSVAPESPILVVRRTSLDSNNVPIEYAIIKYDAARYRLQIELPAQ